MDGRDIGTGDLPDRHRQTLCGRRSRRVRARRRWAELKAMGIRRTEHDVVTELGARDEADKTRPVAP